MFNNLGNQQQDERRQILRPTLMGGIFCKTSGKTTPKTLAAFTDEQKEWRIGLRINPYRTCTHTESENFMESFLARNPAKGIKSMHFVTSRRLMAHLASCEASVKPTVVFAVKKNKHIYVVLSDEIQTPTLVEMTLNGVLSSDREKNDNYLRRGIFHTKVGGRDVIYWSPIDYQYENGEFVSVVPIHPDPNGLHYPNRPYDQYPPNFLVNNGKKAYWTAFFGGSDNMLMPIIGGTKAEPVAVKWLKERTDEFKEHNTEHTDMVSRAIQHLGGLFDRVRIDLEKQNKAAFVTMEEGQKTAGFEQTGKYNKELEQFYETVNKFIKD